MRTLMNCPWNPWPEEKKKCKSHREENKDAPEGRKVVSKINAEHHSAGSKGKNNAM